MSTGLWIKWSIKLRGLLLLEFNKSWLKMFPKNCYLVIPPAYFNCPDSSAAPVAYNLQFSSADLMLNTKFSSFSCVKYVKWVKLKATVAKVLHLFKAETLPIWASCITCSLGPKPDYSGVHLPSSNSLTVLESLSASSWSCFSNSLDFLSSALAPAPILSSSANSRSSRKEILTVVCEKLQRLVATLIVLKGDFQAEGDWEGGAWAFLASFTSFD